MTIKITAIEGNRQKLDGGAMFGNVPRPLWSKWLKADEQGRIELACRCLLIETDELKILCETGIGAFFEPKLAERFGVETPNRHMLLENLKKIGLSASDIDWVILSHLHFDHAGGLLPAYGQSIGTKDELVFPRAKFVVGQKALERAKDPHLRDRASFIAGLPEKLQQSNRLVIAEKNYIPGLLEDRLSLLFSDGHTPGHMHVLMQGDKEKVFFCGDLIPGSAWLHLPVTMGYDRYPELLINEKSSVYEQAVPQQWLMFFTHDPEYSLSKCQFDESKKLIPIEKEQNCERRVI